MNSILDCGFFTHKQNMRQQKASNSPTKPDPFAASQSCSWSVTYWMLIAQREREIEKSFIFRQRGGRLWRRHVAPSGRWADLVVCSHVIRIVNRNESLVQSCINVFKKMLLKIEDALKQDPSTIRRQHRIYPTGRMGQQETCAVLSPQQGLLPLWTSAVALTAPRFQETF